MSLLLLFGGSAGPATFSGSGDATLPALTASGTAERDLKGSGAVSLPVLTAAGSGTKTRPGVGASTLPILTATGAAKIVFLGSGAVSLTLLAGAGTGTRSLLGSGAGTLPPITGSGGNDSGDEESPLGPYAAFVDRVPTSFVFDIPKDDEEVLLMFAQFVATQVH